MQKSFCQSCPLASSSKLWCQRVALKQPSLRQLSMPHCSQQLQHAPAMTGGLDTPKASHGGSEACPARYCLINMCTFASGANDDANFCLLGCWPAMRTEDCFACFCMHVCYKAYAVRSHAMRLVVLKQSHCMLCEPCSE